MMQTKRFIQQTVALLLIFTVLACSSPQEHKVNDPTLNMPTKEPAPEFVARIQKEMLEINKETDAADWVRATYITEDTAILAAKAGEKHLAFLSSAVAQAKTYIGKPTDETTQRALDLILLSTAMPAPNNEEKRAELSRIATDMEGMYGAGKYCTNDNTCRNLGDLEKVLLSSRDYQKQLDAWLGWRTISVPMRPMYQRFVELANEGATEFGYDNLATMWKSGYDMQVPAFEKEADRLWGQVEPLYKQLHCYVRNKLSDHYGKAKVSKTDPIPAHLLGNMWAQTWTNIYDLVEPYPGVSSLDITQALVDQKYDAVKMTKTAEAFFTSIGLPELPESFWQNSMLTKPRDRDVVCHASAWDMGNGNDPRIKQCVEPNEDQLATLHHELGHIYYFMMYKDQPPLFKTGAHDGFHEAIGDTIVLSMTPRYLKEKGLINTVSLSHEALINEQMKMALDKIAFLPFGKLIDQWRWQVFSGEISPENYNAGWWALRKKYQGIAPPVARSEQDFDPGAKYHIPGNTPYTRYFLSFIMQFQFHKSLCATSGHTGPLNECSIYGNKVAGKKLGDVLSMGASRPWPEAMEALTGQRQMDASAILDYFAPLSAWLTNETKDQKCGW